MLSSCLDCSNDTTELFKSKASITIRVQPVEKVGVSLGVANVELSQDVKDLILGDIAILVGVSGIEGDSDALLDYGFEGAALA